MDRNQDREKFVRLAEKRVNRTIKDIRLVGNLANKSNYSYTEEDVKKIVKALEAELARLKQRFERTFSADEAVFRL